MCSGPRDDPGRTQLRPDQAHLYPARANTRCSRKVCQAYDTYVLRQNPQAAGGPGHPGWSLVLRRLMVISVQWSECEAAGEPQRVTDRTVSAPKDVLPIRESALSREATRGVGLSPRPGALAASPPGKKSGRATRGTWTTRCPGHPAEATSADHEADSMGRRVVTDREERRVDGPAVTPIATGKTEPSFWPWESHGPLKMLS
jgi:hypothetical protein